MTEPTTSQAVARRQETGGTVWRAPHGNRTTTVVRFRPNARVIATSGVTYAHSELVTAARPCDALLAFDSDHRINRAVCRQLARLIIRSRRRFLRQRDKRVSWMFFAAVGFAERTPLWHYILAEAAFHAKGKHLGPLESILVAEVLIGLIEKSENSILRNPVWEPTLPHTGKFKLEDLLRLAGMLP